MVETAMTELDDRRVIWRFGSLIAWLSALCCGVMVLGSAVRATGSGLACPDWPLCFNQLIPQFDFQIFLEWFHRLVAALFALSFLYAFYVVLREKILRSVFSVQLGVIIFLLAVQIILGGLTVLRLLEPKIVSLHLINALLMFSIMLWIYRKSRILIHDTFEFRMTKKTKVLTYLTFVLLCVQMTLGGMVSSNYAGLACPDFPLCYGKILPPANFLVYLQVTHRLVAALLMICIFTLAISSFNQRLSFWTKSTAYVLPIAVSLQVVLGIANVYLGLPVWASVLHLANGVLMFGLSCLSVFDTFYGAKHYPINVIPSQSPAKNIAQEFERI